MYFLFARYDTPLQMAKNTKSGPGFWPGRFALMIGKRRMVAADPPQFTIVEKGKKSGSTISGIYIHTIGPKLNPKLAM